MSKETARNVALRNIQLAVVALSCIMIFLFLFTFLQLGGEKERKDASAEIKAEVLPVASVIDGKDSETGLIAAEGYLIVKQNCVRCHSAKLIIQNHLSRDRWEKSIRWMQKNQNLGDLGVNEKSILDYLEKNYGPTLQGRRKTLEKQTWYYLK